MGVGLEAGDRADQSRMHGRQVAGGASPLVTARLDARRREQGPRRAALAKEKETETCATVVMLPPTVPIDAAGDDGRTYLQSSRSLLDLLEV
jgi:hypothetical protein